MSHAAGSTFCDILRTPDRVTAYKEPRHPVALSRAAAAWQATGIEVRTQPAQGELVVMLTASLPLVRLHLRWNAAVDASVLILGDAWERSYGELAWRGFVPERAMPWYFATHARDGVHGYGVRTGGNALCFWQIDREGISLWLDVSNGGTGVMLGQRELHAATVVSRQGTSGEPPLSAVSAFCRKMCPTPRLPKGPNRGPIYGTNDWYYAYGKNTAAGIYRDTELVASLSPTNGVRPFSVIDMGWEGNPTFPDMAQVAEEIRKRKARPGIWVRPLEAPKTQNPSLLLPVARYGERTSRAAELAYDPTIPEGLDRAMAKIRHAAEWKYELIKHDFSTYDLFGQWGFEMGAQPTIPGWHFSDRSKTNAEIVLDLYRAIRKTAGDSSIVLGCNTIGHLSAGLFEMQRTGDDTSGLIWERTRRMGVNTLAYRLPQHGTFFVQDADCVGITKDVPWSQTRDWLDLVARSGTALFLSPSPDAVGEEQKAAIREAFAIAASGDSTGRPIDWLGETAPQDWQFADVAPGAKHYNWSGEDGCDPFPI
jgi:alpha-galactosidase